MGEFINPGTKPESPTEEVLVEAAQEHLIQTPQEEDGNGHQNGQQSLDPKTLEPPKDETGYFEVPLGRD